MDRTTAIKELKEMLFNNSITRHRICAECSFDGKCERENKPICDAYYKIAEVIIDAGYSKYPLKKEEKNERRTTY